MSKFGPYAGEGVLKTVFHVLKYGDKFLCLPEYSLHALNIASKPTTLNRKTMVNCSNFLVPLLGASLVPAK